jgi:hypothetical protein
MKIPKALVFQANTVRRTTEQKDHLATLPPAVGVVAAATFSAGTLLNALFQGVTAGTRLGRKIAMRSILIHYSIALSSTSVGGTPARIMVVYDKQSNGIAPLITDILTFNDFNAPNNLNNSDRFITLFNEITDPISTQNNFSIAKILYRKLGLEVVYKDTSNGDITDIATGAIYAFIAQTSAVTVVTPACLSFTRIRYEDN